MAPGVAGTALILVTLEKSKRHTASLGLIVLRGSPEARLRGLYPNAQMPDSLLSICSPWG